ncbi:hypothetical protein DICVIV_08197 [Dictyocaulus viviparus]|uniref:RRM domain-containing protein n=1 Tax=Dictyocaulus viviparus TaxID=29172 RepID=A0A0D8XTS0_DICVI|nr:hypothetical protein DICVIV_08197 [Dictyocaulus viviparus]
MSYGGYGNRTYDYHQRRERINEDEVPESKHTIFIRGLPGDMSTDEIKEYFEDRIGPVSFDFVKTSADQQRLFVAVRFETRDDAKEAMNKYSENDLMGHRCELSWFKDIRRYAQYQNLSQSRRGRPMFRNRSYQHSNGRGRDSFKRRYSERDDDKSRSRSRDRARSSSYSRSPSARSGESSRTRSRSSGRAASEERNRRSASPDSSSDQGMGRDKDKERDGDPEKKRRKKEKKNKKSKKKEAELHHEALLANVRRLLNVQYKYILSPFVVGRHAPAGSPVSPNQEDSPTPITVLSSNTDTGSTFAAPLPAATTTAPITVRFPIRSQTPANVISNTTFAIGIDSDELPRRVLRRMSPTTPVVTPPSVAAQEEEKILQDMTQKDSPQTVINSIGLPPPPCPPSFNSEKLLEQNDGNVESLNKKSASSTPDPSVHVSVRQNISSIPPSTIIASSDCAIVKPQAPRFPTSSRFFGSLKEIQSSIIKTVKVEQKSDEGSGGLRLSNLAMCQQDADEEKRTIREGRLSKLDDISLERFMVKKKRLEETFRGDCQTYAFVARKLIEKDPSLESQLRIALIENMEDLEKQVYEQIDAYLDTVFD